MLKIHLFDNDSQPEAFAADQAVFRAGDKGDCMFAVIQGAVGIIIAGKAVETVEAGGIFGEMALVEDKPRVASAEVRSDAKLVRIDRRRFSFLVQQTPFFALQVMGIMAERLRRMDEKL